MLASHNRYRYSGIDTRPKYCWPGGKSLALYVAVNAEHFPFGAPGGIDLDRETKPWSQRSWLWREYGNRVGGWRLLEMFEQLGVPPTVLVNTECYEHCPELVYGYRAAGAEFVAHGRTNSLSPNELEERDEREMIQDVFDTM